MTQATLTVEDLIRSVEVLRGANVPAFEDGYYRVFISRRQAESIRFWWLVGDSCYRQELLARAILDHERRRKDMGRRPDEPTAIEAFLRAWRHS